MVKVREVMEGVEEEVKDMVMVGVEAVVVKDVEEGVQGMVMVLVVVEVVVVEVVMVVEEVVVVMVVVVEVVVVEVVMVVEEVVVVVEAGGGEGGREREEGRHSDTINQRHVGAPMTGADCQGEKMVPSALK